MTSAVADVLIISVFYGFFYESILLCFTIGAKCFVTFYHTNCWKENVDALKLFNVLESSKAISLFEVEFNLNISNRNKHWWYENTYYLWELERLGIFIPKYTCKVDLISQKRASITLFVYCSWHTVDIQHLHFVSIH